MFLEQKVFVLKQGPEHKHWNRLCINPLSWYISINCKTILAPIRCWYRRHTQGIKFDTYVCSKLTAVNEEYHPVVISGPTSLVPYLTCHVADSLEDWLPIYGSYWYHNLNSSPPSAAYMRQWAQQALVQVMACRLFGAKPLPEPMLAYCQLDP